MKAPFTCIAAVMISVSLLASGSVELPKASMMQQLEWALNSEPVKQRADRLEAFWHAHLPLEDGGTNPSPTEGYEDGVHIGAIIQCAWHLTRAYIESNQREKALSMIDWLAEHESKTGLAPVTNKAEQGESLKP